ncbi:hypothetical protein ABK040_002798 [Willaertia magna]
MLSENSSTSSALGLVSMQTKEAYPENSILCYVNGERVIVTDPNPELSLAEYLRNDLRLTGTKIGCNEGGCGACVVMVSNFDNKTQRVNNRAVNSCLFPLIQADGCAIITVEGVGDNKQDILHLIQQRIGENFASQCGFCTAGFIMSLYALLRNNPYPTLEDIERSIDGNLCRCTGYSSIYKAFSGFAKSEGEEISCCGKSTSCCKNNKEQKEQEKETNGCCGNSKDGKCCKGEKQQGEQVSDKLELSGQKHVLFPFELRNYKPRSLKITNEKSLSSSIFPMTWYRPTSLDELLQIRNEHKTEHTRFVVGNSEVAIEQRFKYKDYKTIIQLTHIDELNNIQVITENNNAKEILIGSSVTLTAISNFLREQIEILPKHQTSGLIAFIEQLKWFASTPIRNCASIGGNIVTASPISDINPLLVAMECQLTIMNPQRETRQVEMRNFFKGYRIVDLKEDEILLTVSIPLNQNEKEIEVVKEYKQAKRREDDIAIVTSGMKMLFTEDPVHKYIVKKCVLAYGGMSFKTVVAEKTSNYFIGKPFNQETLKEGLECLKEDLPLSPNAPGGMVEYRKTLSLSFLFKFLIMTVQQLAWRELTVEEENMIQTTIPREYPTGNHYFKTPEMGAGVGEPLLYNDASLKSTGEAKYVDDIAPQYRECHAALVISQKPFADIVSVDPSAALALKGVISFVDYRDVKGSNTFGEASDEELFLINQCTSTGQLIGLVVAETAKQAKIAARLVDVKYKEKDEPLILSIQDAIKHNSFFPGTTLTVKDGNAHEFIEKVRNNSSLSEDYEIITGDMNMGGQEHFYIETNGCLIIPNHPEKGEYVVYSSTQNPTLTQFAIAKALGVPAHKVVSKVKRIGGGFGGKETRGTFISSAAAVAAAKVNRPVRVILERDVDMAVTGQRHPFHCKYTAVINKKTLKLESVDVNLYCNGGFSIDLSRGVNSRGVLLFENCYHIPNYHIKGHICKTHLQSNTAFRAFGGQAMLFMESIIEHCASTLENITQVPSIELSYKIREANMYNTENPYTPYKMKIDDVERIQKLWKEVQDCSDYRKRLEQVEQFNKQNKYRKRGISLIPTKYGIGFGLPWLNQGGALINIYHEDGSVLISIGGVELGQGLMRKCEQCASATLNIPVDFIHTCETSTDKVPNTSPTAASVGLDINGQAVVNACEELNKRLEPIKRKLYPELFENSNNNNPKLTHEQWKKVIDAAYHNTISLSATGYYTFTVNMDWEKSIGRPYKYMTYGTACSEVEIDTLTGEWSVCRTDICMDIGNSVNPEIDIGQIEGAFIQGMGLFTCEELVWGDAEHSWFPKGQLFTKGPGVYKIPSANDVPVEFNVHLLKDASNPHAVYSSKAVGEPPLFLGSTVFFAIRNAIENARKDHGKKNYFILDSPATCERIRMLCSDEFTQQVVENEETYRVKGSY